ncbi:MAG: amidohydrolase family protein [Phycisphaerales bacterium]|jgi:imidazolonepropionase-like amidohydrolase|nr:amidohydrolase family protein [Phycisphaerales bacterium]
MRTIGSGGWWVGLAIAGGVALCTSAARAQETPTAFINARVIPIDGAEIDRGYVIVRDGKIVAVGAGDAPGQGRAERAEVDCAGKVVMPGLVDTHSHIGGIGGADGSGPIQPGVRVRDSINVRDSGFRRALAGGLTTVNIMPGSGHLSSGQTVYAKLRFGDEVRTIDDITIWNEGHTPAGGLKMANGTNSQRGGGGAFPGTRGRSAFLVRNAFIKAQEYKQKLDAARREDGSVDESKLPERDLDMEVLVEVLEGKRVVHHHTHRHDDIMTVLRLADEFGFRVVLHHVSDGWLVADEIASAHAGVSAILVDSPGGKHEAVGLRFETPGVLERAGAVTALHTDDWITDSRLLLRMAGLAVRGGMTRQGALESVTIAGAKLLDLEDRVGSLTPGKDADLIILSGDPLSVYTVVEQTYVEGRLAFDRSRPDDRLHAMGGYNAATDTEPYFCCYDAEMKHAAGLAQSGGGQ